MSSNNSCWDIEVIFLLPTIGQSLPRPVFANILLGRHVFIPLKIFFTYVRVHWSLPNNAWLGLVESKTRQGRNQASDKICYQHESMSSREPSCPLGAGLPRNEVIFLKAVLLRDDVVSVGRIVKEGCCLYKARIRLSPKGRAFKIRGIP
jgi:hypothetical protein